MDDSTLLLLLLQGVTFLLLIVSETLPLSDSPYSGIIQAIIGMLEKETDTLKKELK